MAMTFYIWADLATDCKKVIGKWPNQKSDSDKDNGGRTMRNIQSTLALLTAGLLVAGCDGAGQPEAMSDLTGEQEISAVQSAGTIEQFDASYLGPLVGNAQTVIFGEDSHGMDAIHQVVPQMFRYLVEEHDFRVFVFEVQWNVTEGIQDFLDSDRTELNSDDSYWLNGAFASQHIADMLVWIREFNKANPDDPILIAGYQPEQPVTDFRNLLTYLDRIAPDSSTDLRAGVDICRASDSTKYKTELDFIIDGFKYRNEGKPSFTDEERSACLKGIRAINMFLDTHQPELVSSSDQRAFEYAKLQAQSLDVSFDVLRRAADSATFSEDTSIEESTRLQGIVYHHGDMARHNIYQKLKEMNFADKRIFHWMHNWHGFKYSSDTGPSAGAAGIPEGTHSFGERTYAHEGSDNVIVIGNVVPCRETCDEPENSIEVEFDRMFGEQPTWVTTSAPEAETGIGFNTARDLYANHHGFGFSGVVLSRQADAVLYLPKSLTVRDAAKARASKK